jgi:hypothetical protein
MRQQRRSETFRKGEPDSHKDSAQSVCDIVEADPYYLSIQRKTIVFPDGYKHEFDIVVNRISHFVEIGDVGDDSKHQLPHKSQLINDGVAQAHVEEYFPESRYVKINKDDAFYKEWVHSKLAGLL